MAASLKPRYNSQTSLDIGSQVKDAQSKRFALKLSLGHLTAIWLGAAVIMFAVFLLGIRTGREQGLKIAIEEQGTPTLRLTVVDPEQKNAEPAPAGLQSKENEVALVN